MKNFFCWGHRGPSPGALRASKSARWCPRKTSGPRCVSSSLAAQSSSKCGASFDTRGLVSMPWHGSRRQNGRSEPTMSDASALSDDPYDIDLEATTGGKSSNPGDPPQARELLNRLRKAMHLRQFSRHTV